MKIRNVLSLFDGISGARLALDRVKLKYDNYYSSEIDKYAIKIAQKNYSDNIQLGDISNWRNWKLKNIDLIIGGSPCQGFSYAGKKLNFKDERSKLFFKFVDILNFYKPKYFILENVKMKKEYQKVISEHLNIEPIEINSSLVSAQHRKRLYWTNIKNIKQPKDKKILLRDILLTKDKYISGAIRGRRKSIKGIRKDYNYNINSIQYIELKEDDKSNCL